VVIRVQQHKTKTTGSAMITVKGALLEWLSQYLQHLRPLLPDSPILFPNARGNPFDHLSRKVQQLGERYNLKLPTATEGRHTAATAMKCSDQERDAVALTMSHSRAVQMSYYVNLKSKEEASKGFDILQGLRQGKLAADTKPKRVPYSIDRRNKLKSGNSQPSFTAAAHCSVTLRYTSCLALRIPEIQPHPHSDVQCSPSPSGRSDQADQPKLRQPGDQAA
jgi:hypothetical protein